MTFGINGAELIILALLAVLILGPEKLPEYTRKLTEWIRNLRRMAEGAKTQFREETGTDFDEIDWKKYDPRQYDPRRIIKDALADPVEGDSRGPAAASATGRSQGSTAAAPRGLRGELDSVRSQRDELREDLKDMDPRALFFGKTSSRSKDNTARSGTDAPVDGREQAGESGPAGGNDSAAPADAGTGHPAGAPLVPAATPRDPAPFDVDAT